MTVLRKVIPDPFLVFLVATIALASLLPARGGFAVAVNWLATAAVFLLFFFHGAKLARQQIVAGFAHWRLHLAILGSTFGMFPLVGLAASRLLAGQLPNTLVIGVLFLAALPSTAQSAVAFVGIAGGNVAAAIASASASQMLGIVLTPALMSVMAGGHSGAGGLSGIGEVALQIFVPFAAGHLLRPLVGGWVARHKTLVGLTDRSTILIAVYGAFSAAVINGVWHKLPLAAFGILLAVCIAFLSIGLAFTWLLGGLCGFDREDRIALLFCGTKKSLVQGVPMAKVLFPGPVGGIVLLPIMLFHQIQLMACALIARKISREDPAPVAPDTRAIDRAVDRR